MFPSTFLNYLLAPMLIPLSLEAEFSASLFSIQIRTCHFLPGRERSLNLSEREVEVFPIKEDKERSDLKLASQPHRSRCARTLQRPPQHRRLHYYL